jgi:hypothetical protein
MKHARINDVQFPGFSNIPIEFALIDNYARPRESRRE